LLKRSSKGTQSYSFSVEPSNPGSFQNAFYEKNNPSKLSFVREKSFPFKVFCFQWATRLSVGPLMLKTGHKTYACFDALIYATSPSSRPVDS